MNFPYATVVFNGKTSSYKIDDSTEMYGVVIQKVIECSMSQDFCKLPSCACLVNLLPKRALNKLFKAFMLREFEVEFMLDNGWTYMWKSPSYTSGGWFFNGKCVKRNEDAK